MLRTPKNPKRFYCTQSLFVRIVTVDLTNFSLLAIKLIFVLFQDCNIRPKSKRLSPPQVHCNHSFWVIDSWILEHGILQGDNWQQHLLVGAPSVISGSAAMSVGLTSEFL